MTTETENKNTEVAYYVYFKDPNHISHFSGKIMRHEKGNGVDIQIGKVTYTGYPPKAKPEGEEEA